MRIGRFGLTAAAALLTSLPFAVSAQQAPPPGATQAPPERMERAPAPPGTPSSPTPSTQSSALSGLDVTSAMNSGDLIGKRVKNSANETIGQIDALLVSKDARVVGVVLDVGGFLGVGGRKVVVPMDQLNVAGSDITIPNATKEQLQQAPAYEKPKT